MKKPPPPPPPPPRQIKQRGIRLPKFDEYYQAYLIGAAIAIVAYTIILVIVMEFIT